MANMKYLAITARNQNYIHEESNSTVNPEKFCCASKHSRFSLDFPPKDENMQTYNLIFFAHK